MHKDDLEKDHKVNKLGEKTELLTSICLVVFYPILLVVTCLQEIRGFVKKWFGK